MQKIIKKWQINLHICKIFCNFARKIAFAVGQYTLIPKQEKSLFSAIFLAHIKKIVVPLQRKGFKHPNRHSLTLNRRTYWFKAFANACLSESLKCRKFQKQIGKQVEADAHACIYTCIFIVRLYTYSAGNWFDYPSAMVSYNLNDRMTTSCPRFCLCLMKNAAKVLQFYITNKRSSKKDQKELCIYERKAVILQTK